MKVIVILSLFLSFGYETLCFDDEYDAQKNSDLHILKPSLADLVTDLCVIGSACYLSNTLTLGKSLSRGVFELCQSVCPDKTCYIFTNTLGHIPEAIMITGAAGAAVLIVSYACNFLPQEKDQEDNQEFP